MRVLFDHQIFALQRYGGISRYFCELASRVHGMPGHSALVVAPLHVNDYLSGCAVRTWSRRIEQRKGASRLCGAIDRLALPLLTRAADPDIVHRTYYEPLPRPGSRPVVVTVYDMIHELFPQAFSAQDRTSQDKRASVMAADHVICISECTSRDLQRLLAVPAHKISVTYLAQSESFNGQVAPDERPPHGRPYLLYVGQRSGYKNFAGALRAFASSARLRESLDLVVFGGAPLSAQERQDAASLGLRGDQLVELKGSDDDLARAYRHARLFVYPSRYEGFGIPPLEAMACGCPVAASATSSIPEVVGGAAATFDPDDIESVRQSLETLSLDDEARTRAIAAGYERVKQFSWERCARETVGIYERMLGGRAGR